jgi:transcriptional regulator with XRE-family HTH domain
MGVATIGSALAERRRELKLEKGRAAEMIGMSRTTYSSYELDAQRPSVDVFPALAHFLHISIEDLLTLYGASCIAAARSSLARVTTVPETQHEVRRATTPAPAAGTSDVSIMASLGVTTLVAPAEPVATPPISQADKSPAASTSEVSLEMEEVETASEESNDNLTTREDSNDPEPFNAKESELESSGKVSGHKKKKKKKGKKG